ncbi:hypothetical protein LBMAG56_15000 [Verrucomicrobiota bacterium]|nr:hypothetical protein LBMAG56_15000 [Verrucomicrobiota bacterium]
MVGFYLINVGFVTLAVRFGVTAADMQEALESLSTKIGVVMLVLGIMHFLNLAIFTNCRRRALRTRAPTGQPLPPLMPQMKPAGN